MAAASRVVCPQCGANNFDTQAACWKCGAGLVGGRAAAGSAYAPQRPPAVPGAPAAPAPMVGAIGLDRAMVDPAVAVWSAVIYAVLFPSLAIPTALVFFMLDDRRKNEIGRLMLLTGVVALVIHTVVTAMLMQPLIHELQGFVKAWGEANGHAQPNLNDTIDTSKFPAGFR